MTDDYVIGNDENGIPDKNLYDAVMKEADSNRDGVLTASEAKNVTSLTRLSKRNNKIKNIKGITYLKNLTSLVLDNNQINNISVLRALTNLIYLSLNNNQINDISILSGFTNLHSLYLDSNQISDISALSALTNLLNLDLSNNQICDITPIKSVIESIFAKQSESNPFSYYYKQEGRKLLFTRLSIIHGNNIPKENYMSVIPEEVRNYKIKEIGSDGYVDTDEAWLEHELNSVISEKNGLVCDSDNVWRYYENGAIIF